MLHVKFQIMAEAKRFYVGNLVADINEDDLRSLFDRFGSVSSVDIKNKRDIDGNVTATFAFVKLDELSDNDVTNVIKQCNHLKWKKQIIRVQLAQESFMDRLQKEREGSQKQQVWKFDFKKSYILLSVFKCVVKVTLSTVNCSKQIIRIESS